MTVITSFVEKRRERQVKFERSVLRELSLEGLKKGFQTYFGSIKTGSGLMLDQAIEEGCYDVAVESYLLGSRFSRLGYYGEPLEEIMKRSTEERTLLAKALMDFISYWSGIGQALEIEEQLKSKCNNFVNYWWQEGYMNGKMKYKMKLH
ncbi:DUF2521 family protein [Bacillus kwashiorkori]|uniref:DUF2521 family protein n=1 Tax=Bacillus kwashiorkori TaxID=1522318 RepID=UPI00078053AB|nr:DUF2521 family protein [Bacillus kwashiorkori]